MDTQLSNKPFCWSKWGSAIFLFLARQMYSLKLLQPQAKFGLPCAPTATQGQRHSGAPALRMPGAAETLPAAVSLLIAQTS